MLLCYNALRLELPHRVQRFQGKRDATDPVYFEYEVRVRDGGFWHWFTFYVNDRAEPGLLIVEDLEHRYSRG